MTTLVKFLLIAGIIYGVVGIITDDQTGSKGPLHRAKRYANYPRIPLAYMNRINPASIIEEQDGLPISYANKRYVLASRDSNNSPVSHFREYQQQQSSRPDVDQQDQLTAYPVLSRRAARRLVGAPAGLPSRGAINEIDQESGSTNPRSLDDLTNQLNDEDLQTLLLLLDGYALTPRTGNTLRNSYKEAAEMKSPLEQYYNPTLLSPEDLRRVARMYAMGKRENEGRFFDLEQPANMDNAANEKLQFITAKRSKRVGPKNPATNRYKKETDPESAAELDQVFLPPRALPLVANPKMVRENSKHVTTDKAEVTTGDHKGHTAATQGQIPPPVGAKSKKAVDWSEYFGIDKKSGKPEARQGGESTSTRKPSPENFMAAKKPTSTPSAGGTHGAKPKGIEGDSIIEPMSSKETKDEKQLRVREENETENKSDRKWILNEFYKNLAMATNIKKKREAPMDDADDLSDLEVKMENAGDNAIWESLKYKDGLSVHPITPSDLSTIKEEIFEKLTAAYNLDKLREAIDGFRDQFDAVKTNNI